MVSAYGSGAGGRGGDAYLGAAGTIWGAAGGGGSSATNQSQGNAGQGGNGANKLEWE